MKDIRQLDETDSFVLLSEHEDVFLFDKGLNKEVWRASMYGNVICGLLGLAQKWAVIAGEHIVVWLDNSVQHIRHPELKWIHEIRQTGDNEIELLIDPWSDNPAIWKLNVKTLEKKKISDFPDYKNKPYQEKIDW